MDRDQANEWLDWIQPITRQYSKGMLPAGSYRRGKAEIGDLDIVVLDGDVPLILGEIQNREADAKVLRCGDHLGTIVVNGTQLEFYHTTLDALGATLLYATGSALFNESMRALAKRKGYKLNQYGLWRGTSCYGGSSEDEVFNLLGLEMYPPELRNGGLNSPAKEPVTKKGMNQKVAGILLKIGKAYGAKSDPWRAKSFLEASDIINRWPTPVSRVTNLLSIPGIGPSIATEIESIIKTGGPTKKRPIA